MKLCRAPVLPACSFLQHSIIFFAQVQCSEPSYSSMPHAPLSNMFSNKDNMFGYVSSSSGSPWTDATSWESSPTYSRYVSFFRCPSSRRLVTSCLKWASLSPEWSLAVRSGPVRSCHHTRHILIRPVKWLANTILVRLILLRATVQRWVHPHYVAGRPRYVITSA